MPFAPITTPEGASFRDMVALKGTPSIGGSMAVTVASCRDMLPDPEFYVRCFKDSFEELCDASNVTRV